MKIEINTKTVKAMQLLAARNDVRFYLNGLLVEVAGGSQYYVATNGHVLGVYRESEPVACDDTQVIIPAEILDKIKVGKNSPELATLTVGHPARAEVVPWANGGKASPAIEEVKHVLEYDGVAYSFMLDARYADWRRVLPREFSGAAGHFDPSYPVIFQKVAGLLGKKAIQIAQNGEGAAGVSIESCPNFLGVLMPCRPGFEFAVPDWVAGGRKRAGGAGQGGVILSNRFWLVAEPVTLIVIALAWIVTLRLPPPLMVT